jgi:hypothetical protein
MASLAAPASPRTGEAAARAPLRLGRLSLAGLALFLLCGANVVRYGVYSPPAVAVLVAALLVTLLAASWRGPAWSQGRLAWVALAVATALVNLLWPLTADLSQFARQPSAVVGVEVGASLLLAACVGAAAWMPRRGATLPLLVAGFVAVLMIIGSALTWGFAGIDVFSVVTGATRALLHAHNPYTPLFFFHPPRVWEHFVYGPAVPVLAAPGYLLGDVRAMSVVAVAATIAGLWHLARQGTFHADAHRVAAVAVACPFWAGMVVKSWVDVYLLAGFVGWMALRREHPRWAVAALAIAILVKPTALIPLVPFFLWSRSARREIVVAVVAAVLVELPFALITGLSTFVYATIGFQLSTPFRTDSLNLAAWLYRLGATHLPVLLPVAMAGLGALLIAWRGRPRVEGELALQAALLTAAAWLLAKQAFFDYWFDCAVLLLAAMASAGSTMVPSDTALPGWAPARREGGAAAGAAVPAPEGLRAGTTRR